ncbi:MAG: flagellar hook-length control protein FliK [Vicinamibacterales bacterium]
MADALAGAQNDAAVPATQTQEREAMTRDAVDDTQVGETSPEPASTTATKSVPAASFAASVAATGRDASDQPIATARAATQGSAVEPIVPQMPRPSARVAHAIAAFQAAASAAGTSTAPANAAATAAGTSSAVLDSELPTQLVQAIRVQFDNGSGAAHVRLNPGFLGGVSVGVQVDGLTVVASLHASSADVREWMQRNEQGLRQALADQGLHLDRLVIVDEDTLARVT